MRYERCVVRTISADRDFNNGIGESIDPGDDWSLIAVLQEGARTYFYFQREVEVDSRYFNL